jgi:PKD repeat protein
MVKTMAALSKKRGIELKRNSLLILLIIPLLLATTAIDMNEVFATTPMVYVDPEVSSAAQGHNLILNVSIADVQELFTWQFNMTWNASIIWVSSVTEGDFLKAGYKPTMFLDEYVNQAAGYAFIGCTILGADWNGTSGSGTLATFNFTICGKGETELVLSNIKLLNVLGGLLSYTKTDGFFTNLHLPAMAQFTFSPDLPETNQIITFNASASSEWADIVSYVWDFDDGNVSTVSSPIISHRYESPRIYNVTLTITDSEELSSSLSKEVWVRVPTYIDMATVDWAFIGFTIGVSGRLTDMHGNYLKNENVTLQRFIGGNTWAVLASDVTDDFGNYLTDWKPATVGSYVVKVNWSGNQTFFPAESINKTISIRSIPTRISLALSSSTSLIGFQVAISGDLISDIRAVSNAPVLLSYSVTAGKSWNDITLVDTALDGRYSAVWMPQATGNYVVKAVWAGNSTYPALTANVNLAVLSSGEQTVFSVISNSTVSQLIFNSTQNTLSFTVGGSSGTAGYANIYIAKTLIGNIEEVEVKLNGTEIEYTATSPDDSWLIHFTYQHSTHTVTVNLGFETEAVDGGLPLLLYFIVGAAAIALVCGIAVMRIRKNKNPRK